MAIKKIIENINPETGVTAEQIYKQCHYLIHTIPASHKLSDVQKNEAINDTVLFITKKFASGEVNKFDYEKFKGYLFIILKNGVLKQHEIKKYKKNSFSDSFVNVAEYDPDYFIHYDSHFELSYRDEQEYYLKKAMDELSQEDRDIIAAIMENEDEYLMTVLARFNKPKGYYKTIKLKLKSLVNELQVMDKQKKFQLVRKQKINN